MVKNLKSVLCSAVVMGFIILGSSSSFAEKTTLVEFDGLLYSEKDIMDVAEIDLAYKNTMIREYTKINDIIREESCKSARDNIGDYVDWLYGDANNTYSGKLEVLDIEKYLVKKFDRMMAQDIDRERVLEQTERLVHLEEESNKIAENLKTQAKAKVDDEATELYDIVTADRYLKNNIAKAEALAAVMADTDEAIQGLSYRASKKSGSRIHMQPAIYLKDSIETLRSEEPEKVGKEKGWLPSSDKGDKAMKKAYPKDEYEDELETLIERICK